MRIRTTNADWCPVLSCTEYGWNTTTSPYGRHSTNHSVFCPGFHTWALPGGYRSYTQTIQDELGDNGAFRNCTNTTETNEFTADMIGHSFVRSARGNTHVANVTAATINSALSLRAAPAVDMSAMADEAMAFMLPRLNQGTSIVNFILELKDLKRMNPVPSIRRVFSNDGKVRKVMSDVAFQRKIVKDLAKRLSGAHLNAEFGIIPLIRDVVEARDTLLDLQRNLKRLKRYANSPQVRHYKRVIPASAGVPAHRNWVQSSSGILQVFSYGSTEADWLGGGQRAFGQHLMRGRWTKRPVYHATMRYTYTLPKMSEAEEQVAVHLDALGARLDPSIVWNAIPFTFLVDWVVDVSGFLQSFARDNFPIQTTVRDFCHSLAYRAEYEVDVIYSGQNLSPYVTTWNWYSGNHVTRVYRGTRSYYSRVRHAPNIHTATTKGYNLRKAALSGSLLLNLSLGGNSRVYRR